MSVALEHGFERWTATEILALPQSADRYELLEGSLIVSPYASLLHQRVAHRLEVLLDDVVPAGWEILAPANFRISEETLLIPDLVVAKSDVVDAGGVSLGPGTISLVVEIVSRSSQRIDRLVKPSVYAEAGIPNYWRLEIEPHPLLVVYSLDGDSCTEGNIMNGVGIITEPFSMTLDIPSLLAKGEK